MVDFVALMDFEMAKKDFRFFFCDILGYDMAAHHEEWFEMAENNKKICVRASRDHGKSVFFTVGYSLWKCLQDDYQIIVFSHSQDQTIRHFEIIDSHISSHPALQHLKPSQGWAKSYFKLTNGSSMLAKSVGASVRGAHPDMIVCDDILAGTAQTKLDTAKEWFYKDMIPMLHFTSPLIIVGTPFAYTDLYCDLEDKPGYLVSDYPALNENDEPLWPERWNYDALMERRDSMSAIAFTREYLCVPMDSGVSIFPIEVLEECFDTDIKFLRSAEDGKQYFIGYDPALSKHGDYVCMIVIEMDENRQKRIVHMVRKKGLDFRGQINILRELSTRFRPDLIEIEANMFQEALVMELRDIDDLPISPFKTTRTKKESMLFNLQMNFEQGHLKIPRGDEATRRLTDIIVFELGMFGVNEKGKLTGIGAHDDTVMALALANRATREFRDKMVLLDDKIMGDGFDAIIQ